MSDLKDPRWIHLKGWMFLLIGLMAVTLILIEVFSWRIAALLALAIWAFCRFYYYAFYVIEKYVDCRPLRWARLVRGLAGPLAQPEGGVRWEPLPR